MSASALLLGGVSLSLELTLDDSERRSHSLLDCELQSSVALKPTRTSACFGFFRIDLVGVLDSELISLTCSEAVAAPASEVTGWSGGEMEGTRSSPLLLLPPLAELELLSGAETTALQATAAGAVTFWPPPPMKSSRCLWTDRY